MKNRWNQLPKSAPFLYPGDENVLREMGVDTAQENYKMVPIPFMGDFQKAKAVLLLLNPGFLNEGWSDISMQNSNPQFVARARENLIHKHQNNPPFLLLDKKYAFYAGFDWWYKRTKEVIAKVELKNAQTKLACVNLFPYHSVRYRKLRKNLPSQEYSLSIVQQAMSDGKLIVLWNHSHWLDTRNGEIAKMLRKYKNKIVVTKRARHLTKQNLGKRKFEKLCETLKG